MHFDHSAPGQQSIWKIVLMLVIIPFACFLFLWLYLSSVQNDSERDWRLFFLLATATWGALLTVITEILSLLNVVTLLGLSVTWLIVCLSSGFLCLLHSWKRKFALGWLFKSLPPSQMFALASIAAIVIAIGVAALVAPPNNWDSMTYHMSRVMHWRQNHNVSSYPTNMLSQLYLNPWSEFVILHFQILAMGDRFANLVQWFAMVGSIIGVSFIARQFGAGIQGQTLAAVISATIPMGILQGSSTQNDYVTTFWLVCLVSFLMTTREKPELRYPLAAGASLGLAILTKGTAYIYAPPFLLFFLLSRSKAGLCLSWKHIVLIGALAGMVNFGQYARNFEEYGSPLGPYRQATRQMDVDYASSLNTVTSESRSPKAVISNMIRNVSLHLSAPGKGYKRFMESGIQVVHNAMGFDINDPRTTWQGEKYSFPEMSFDEDFAGNPVHLILIVASIIILIGSKGLRANRNLAYYLGALLAGFLLFCTLLKWQPWNSRLHLPLFVLWSPFVGSVFSEIPFRNIAKVLAVGLTFLTIPWLLFNANRPLAGEGNVFQTDRMRQYLVKSPLPLEMYEAIKEVLAEKECSEIGVSLRQNDWEYPLWVVLSESDRNIRIEHVLVENVSKAQWGLKRFSDFCPCAIVSIGSPPYPAITTEKGSYSLEWSAGEVSVYTR
jgi:hypothetical protein